MYKNTYYLFKEYVLTDKDILYKEVRKLNKRKRSRILIMTHKLGVLKIGSE